MSGEGSEVLPDAIGDWSWVGVELADCPAVDGAVHVDLGGLPVCLARSSGRVHALLDECSHGRVALSDGQVDGGLVQCWWHGSCFDLTTGVPTGPPATRAVAVYPVRVTAAGIEVAVPADAGGRTHG